jgi:hypothetical protein
MFARNGHSIISHDSNNNSLVVDDENTNIASNSSDIELDSGMVNDEENEDVNEGAKQLMGVKKLKKQSKPKLNATCTTSKPVTNISTTANTNTSSRSEASTALLLNTSVVSARAQKYLAKYAYDADFGHLNFKKADQSLSLECYTWEYQGYPTAYGIYPDICELLDKNFKIAGNMTYNT